jgi:beta-galactosidase
MLPSSTPWIGAAYYPEHVCPERLEADARLMQEAGVTLVRMAEFTWIRMEPEENRLDFTWLDQAIRVLAAHGISTLLCTPTATPPKWLSDRDPEICQVMADGRRREFGKRRHYCVNSRAYRRHTERIVRALAEHYRDTPHVIGYQIDNEIMAEEPYCHCETCLGKFQAWLQQRHGTIERLNETWGLVFWSQSYRSFSEVIFPKAGHNPSALLEFYHFFSDSYLDYIRFQAGLLRDYSPDKAVTHNVCSSGFLYRMDLNQLGQCMDIVSIDNYPYNWTLEHEYGNKADLPYSPGMAGFALSMTRGYQRNHFWVTEAQVGRCFNPRKIVEPGMMRLWTHQELAHGGRAILFFPWRSFPFGIEYMMHGVLDHDSVPRRRYRELRQVAAELAAMPEAAQRALPFASVALLREFNCDWAFEDGHVNSEFRYLRHLFLYYNACARQHHTIDVLQAEQVTQQHRVILAPSLLILSPETEARLRDFVAAGGSLVLTCLSGLRTPANTFLPELPSPGLRELAGIEIEEQLGLRPGLGVSLCWSAPAHTADDNDTADAGLGHTGTLWADLIKTNSATTLATYGDHYFAGTPAVTLNHFGEGRVYYVATIPDAPFVDRLVRRVMADAALESPVLCDDPLLEVIESRTGEQAFLHLTNFSDRNARVTLRQPHVALRSGTTLSALEVPARDALLLQRT